MKLKTYMARNGLTDVEFGRIIGRERSVVSKMRREKHMPPLELAKDIHRLTRGKVSLHDWRLQDAPE